MVTVSKIIKKSLGPAAWGRMIATMENGRDRTKYPATIAIDITKNLCIFFFMY